MERPCIVALDVSIEESVFVGRSIQRVIEKNGTLRTRRILLTKVSKNWRNLQNHLSIVATKRAVNGEKRSLSLSQILNVMTNDEIFVMATDGTDIWMPCRRYCYWFGNTMQGLEISLLQSRKAFLCWCCSKHPRDSTCSTEEVV